MILHEPFKISARLLPAMQFENVWLSFEASTNTFYLDGLSKEYVIDEYRPSPLCSSIQQCFADILSFMSVAGDCVAWAKRSGEDPFADEGGSANLFPREVSEWCAERHDDLSCLAMDFEEGPQLIEE